MSPELWEPMSAPYKNFPFRFDLKEALILALPLKGRRRLPLLYQICFLSYQLNFSNCTNSTDSGKAFGIRHNFALHFVDVFPNDSRSLLSLCKGKEDKEIGKGHPVFCALGTFFASFQLIQVTPSHNFITFTQE